MNGKQTWQPRAIASYHPRIWSPKYGQTFNLKRLTANRSLSFAVKWPNLDLKVSKLTPVSTELAHKNKNLFVKGDWDFNIEFFNLMDQINSKLAHHKVEHLSWKVGQGMDLIFKYRIIHECVHQSGIYTQVVEVSEIERVTQLVMIMRGQGAGCRSLWKRRGVACFLWLLRMTKKVTIAS